MIIIGSRQGLKPAFNSMVNVSAYNEDQAKNKAIGKVIEKNPIFKRRKHQQYWSFEITNLSKGQKND